MIAKSKIKNQKSKLNGKIKNFVFCIIILMFAICIFNFSASLGFTKEIVILYTGDTHAMLYHCSCPVEPDGGIARRAALIEQLRKENPNTVVLDSGAFFAGGLMDEYTQNIQLDIERTKVNLKAMELMKYDAVNADDEEFNFGKEFFEESISRIKIPFLSSNIESKKLAPFIIKNISGTKIAIIGVSSLSTRQKIGDLKFSEPKDSVKNSIAELKKENPDITIVLSRLSESEAVNLIKDIQGIDIFITKFTHNKNEPFKKINNTLLISPVWQGRKLGKLSLKIDDKNKITDYKAQDLRLSSQISDDNNILTILPKCFSDTNCKKDGFIGVCQNAAGLSANCSFTEAQKINLTVVAKKQCRGCNIEATANYLKKYFPGITVSYLIYPEKRAQELINKLGINTLPVFLLDKKIEKDTGFDEIKEKLQILGDFYMLKSEYGGIAYFIRREKLEDRLDLFISLFEKDTKELLALVKEYNPIVHFLLIEQGKEFSAAKGKAEIEEDLRSACVQKYHPQAFWDYISCRAANIDSSWWQDCANSLDVNKIMACGRSAEGESLLKENIKLNKELQVMFGPAYLLENQEIFATKGLPSKEELGKILNRK